MATHAIAYHNVAHFAYADAYSHMRIFSPHCRNTNMYERRISMGNKKASTRNKKKEDGKFRSKHIKHDPQAESARAVFGVQNPNADDNH